MKKMSRTQKMMLGVVFVPTFLFGGGVVTHADASSGGKNGEVPVVTGFLGDPSQWGLTTHNYVAAEASAGGSKNGEIPVVAARRPAKTLSQPTSVTTVPVCREN